MAGGTTTIQTFEDFIYLLEEIARDSAEATKGEGIKRWAIPEGLRGSGSKFEWETIKEIFSREDINENYVPAVEERNFPESAVMYAQGDVLAGADRDYRIRHMTRIRAQVHAAARREKQGSGSGVATMVIKKWVETIQKDFANG